MPSPRTATGSDKTDPSESKPCQRAPSSRGARAHRVLNTNPAPGLAWPRTTARRRGVGCASCRCSPFRGRHGARQGVRCSVSGVARLPIELADQHPTPLAAPHRARCYQRHFNTVRTRRAEPRGPRGPLGSGVVSGVARRGAAVIVSHAVSEAAAGRVHVSGSWCTHSLPPLHPQTRIPMSEEIVMMVIGRAVIVIRRSKMNCWAVPCRAMTSHPATNSPVTAPRPAT